MRQASIGQILRQNFLIMTQIEIIKAEIERRMLEDYNSSDTLNDEIAQGVCAGILTFINSLSQEPVSEDLDLAAERYACRYADSKYGHDKIKKAYTAGAQWQKERMMKALLDMEKDSVEVEHKYGEGGRELYLKMLGILRPFEED